MGDRFRLKSTFVIPSNWSPETKAIAQAMKDYGLIVADNGSDMFFQGTPSDQWDMDAILQIHSIPMTQFDVVDLTPVVTGLNANSGLIAGGTPVTITGHNFSGAAGQLHVFFGNTEATSVTVLSDSQVLAIAPAHAAGTVDIQVQSGSMRLNTDNQSVFFGYGTSATSSARTISPSAQPLPLRLPRRRHRPRRPLLRRRARAAIRDRQRSGASGDRHHVQPGSHGPVHGPAVRGIVQGGRAGRGGGRDRRRRAGCSGRDRWRNRGAGPHHRWRHARRALDSVARHDQLHGQGLGRGGRCDGRWHDDIALGTNQAGPRAQVFRGGDFLKLSDVVAGPSTNFLGRTFVALADMDHDAKADLVVTGLYRGGTRFAGYNANSLAPTLAPQRIFNAFTLGGGYVNGLFLAVGDVNGDGFADLRAGSRLVAKRHGLFGQRSGPEQYPEETGGLRARGRTIDQPGASRTERCRWRWAARHPHLRRRNGDRVQGRQRLATDRRPAIPLLARSLSQRERKRVGGMSGKEDVKRPNRGPVRESPAG